MKKMCPTKLKSIIFMVIFGVLVLVLIQTAQAQIVSGTTVSVVPSSSTPVLGETLTVNIKISNVQNLYGLDVMFRWNASILQVLSVDLRLGVESHPDGVLHEISPNAEIDIIEDNASPEMGNYHVVATSVNPAPSFSGNGNVAIITFNVTSLGNTGLELETELADYPASGEPSNLIEHKTVAGSIDVIPEFPSILAVALLLVLVTTAVAFSKKRLKPTTKLMKTP